MKKISDKILYQGKWLSLKESTFINNNGKQVVWESIERVKSGPAFGIIAHMIPSDRYVLIRQYRQAIQNHIIGLPAGIMPLKQINEEEINDHIVKELKEETGYWGKVKWKSLILKVNPGMMDEDFFLAAAEINESEENNAFPQQELEPSEQIETILIKRQDMRDFIFNEKQKGTDITVGVWLIFCIPWLYSDKGMY